MTRRVVWAVLTVCGWWAPRVSGEITIPADKAMTAEVVGYLEAPPTQPMHLPTDVAVDAQGQVFVTDGAENRVLVFGSDGTFSREIRLSGIEAFDQPVGLTIGPGGQVWVADTGNHRLAVLSNEGRLLESIDLPSPAEGRPPDPTDVALTKDGGRCYVPDNDNHRLLIRDNNTGEWKAMGSRGRALGEFEYPFTVAVGSEGIVYVNEVMGSRIQMISARDRWAGSFGGWGVELGQLYRAKGIATDSGGDIYISDSTLQVVQVFDSWGIVKGVLCNAQREPLRFAHPMGLCCASRRQLYVVETEANRVAVVSIEAN